jgi:hypothetical protein
MAPRPRSPGGQSTGAALGDDGEDEAEEQRQTLLTVAPPRDHDFPMHS